MPPMFDPNQLGGPTPLTMGGLMNQGVASRARFPTPPAMAGAPPPGPPTIGGGMPSPMPGGPMPGGPMPGGPMPGGPMPIGGPPTGPSGPPPGLPGSPPPGPPEPPAGGGGPPAGAGPDRAGLGTGPAVPPTLAVREAADDAAIRAALQGTKNDPDEAVKTLVQSGHQQAAMKLREAARMHRAQEIQSRYNDVSHREAAMRVGERLLMSATDDPSLNVVRELVSRVNPKMGQILQGDYASVAPNIKEFIQMSAPVMQKLRQERTALDTMRTAIRTGDNGAWTRAAALILSSAKDAGQWTTLINTLKQAGAPPPVLNQFDTVYSDTAVAKAAKIARHTGPTEEEVAGTPFADMGLLRALRE